MTTSPFPPWLIYIESWTLQFFTVVFILVAVITADDNQKSSGGYQVIGFTGIWTSFIMIAIMSLAAQVSNWDSPHVHKYQLHCASSCGCICYVFLFICLYLSYDHLCCWQVVFDEWHSPFVVGSLIGSCIMLSQMQFVMMIVYFVFGDHAKNNEHGAYFVAFFYSASCYTECDFWIVVSICPDVSDSDRALGAFSLFTMVVYLILAAVLTWFSKEITGESRRVHHMSLHNLHIISYNFLVAAML